MLFLIDITDHHLAWVPSLPCRLPFLLPFYFTSGITCLSPLITSITCLTWNLKDTDLILQLLFDLIHAVVTCGFLDCGNDPQTKGLENEFFPHFHVSVALYFLILTSVSLPSPHLKLKFCLSAFLSAAHC